MKKRMTGSLIKIFVCIFLILPATMVFSGARRQTATAGFNFTTTRVDGKDFVNNTFLTGLPIVREPITLRVVATLHPQPEYNNYEQKYFVPIAERATGIKLEWILAADEAITPMVASGDLPDVFWRSMYAGELTSGSFLELTDQALRTFAPNVFNLYQNSFRVWRDFLTMDDGKVYSLAGGPMTTLPAVTDGLVWINTDWLRRVGRNMPTTTTELTEVLRLFRQMDANGNGNANDEIPLNFCNNQWAGGFEQLAGSWGIWGNYNVQNGRILPSINTADYREFLEYFNALAREGLVNVEGFTQTAQQYYGDISAGRVGVFVGYRPGSFTSDPNIVAQYQPLGIVSVPGKEGIKTSYGGSKNKLNTFSSFSITTACRYPEAALRLWDYLSSEEMAPVVGFGPEGLLWRRASSLNIETRGAATEEEYRRFGLSLDRTGAGNAAIGYNNHFPLVLSQSPIVDPALYSTDGGTQRMTGINKILDYVSNEPLPFWPWPNGSDEGDWVGIWNIMEDLNALVSSFRANSVVNGVTDASWNDYVRQLNTTYRYTHYLNWYQNYYDRSF